MRKYIGDRDFYRRVAAVLMPILIQQVITSFVSLLDNIMVGQVGTEPMSGVAIVNQLFFVYYLCVIGGLSGAGILTAQFSGKGDREGIRHSVRVKLILGIGICLICAAVLLLFGDRLIQAFLHEGESGLDLEDTLHHAQDYLDVMLLQILPFMLSMLYASTLRETGETVLPMKAGLIAVFVNLVLNWLLIFGKLGFPRLGVVGAAAATVIARFTEMAIVVIWTHRHLDRFPFMRGVWSSLRVPGEVFRKVIILGMPLLFNELLWSGGMTVLNQCYSVRGLEVVSAMNIYITISDLFFSAFIATGNAISIMVGTLLGAGKLERAVDEDRKLIAFAIALSFVLGGCMALCAPLFPRLYNTVARVRELASEILLIGAMMMPLHAFANSCYFTLRSGGKTLITFLFDSGSVWLLSIPAAFLLAYRTQVPIVPMFAIVEGLNILKCAVGYLMVRRRRWVINLVGRQA